MAETDDTEDAAPKKASKLPLIIGLVLALVGGGGGFFAVYSGMILGGESHEGTVEETHDAPTSSLPDIAFVAIEPLVISVQSDRGNEHLRFRAQLEVPTSHQADVELLLPRVVDVLNGYLRALKISDLDDSAALVRLRAQMLRRVQVVTGQGRVNDLLIMEFVLN